MACASGRAGAGAVVVCMGHRNRKSGRSAPAAGQCRAYATGQLHDRSPGQPDRRPKARLRLRGPARKLVTFDLETVLGLKGLEFFIAASWASGRDLSAKDIGNLFTVSQVFSGQSVRLDQVYFQQTLFDDALDLAVGRSSTGDDFATSDLYTNYVNAAVNPNPLSLSLDAPSFSLDPIASWGLRAIVQPTDQIRLAAGVYNADPDVGEDRKNGVDFVLNPEDGVLAIAEAGYQWNQAEGDTGLPGNATFGGYYDSSRFEFFGDSSDERKGNYGLYALLDQMVYREGGGGSEQGLGGADVCAGRAGKYPAAVRGGRARLPGPVPRPG
jgi:carbohydrate-selective porin OprB